MTPQSITRKGRTDRLCALLLVGSAALAIVFVTLMGIRLVIDEIVRQLD